MRIVSHRKLVEFYKITGTVLVIISFATIKLPNYSDEK